MSTQHYPRFNHKKDEGESEPARGFRLLPSNADGAAFSRKNDRRSKDLARRARRNDRSAFEELHRMHAEDVRAFVSEHIADEEDPREVCQEVWRTVLEQIGEFDEASGLFTTWLHALVVQICDDFVARRDADSKTRSLEGLSSRLVSDESDPLEVAELRNALSQALESVPEREREAFCLVHEDGLTPDEVAARFGVTEEEVETLLEKCAARLRGLLGKFDPRNQ